MTMAVRPARLEDTPGAIALLKQLMSGPRDWDAVARALGQVLADGRLGSVHVAGEDSRLLGVITQSYVYAVRFGGWYSQIEELVVDAAARGKGAGAALVQASIAEARRRGCAEIGLWALPHNVPFYESQGFKLTGGPYLSQRL
jgi:GNAT superfamily N-acetyltransferase